MPPICSSHESVGDSNHIHAVAGEWRTVERSCHVVLEDDVIVTRIEPFGLELEVRHKVEQGCDEIANGSLPRRRLRGPMHVQHRVSECRALMASGSRWTQAP
jgi:hypothetical protein